MAAGPFVPEPLSPAFVGPPFGTIGASSVGGLPLVSRGARATEWHGHGTPHWVTTTAEGFTMALRLQVYWLLNAAEQVVKDGEGSSSALALSNPIGAPKLGRGPAEIRR